MCQRSRPDVGALRRETRSWFSLTPGEIAAIPKDALDRWPTTPADATLFTLL